MESSALYVRSLLRETILLKPNELGSNFLEVVQARLVAAFEGRCSRHGFIRPGSIAVHSVTQGRVVAASLNGDIHADVEYFASVCNPAIGSILKSRIIKVNPRLGIMTHCLDMDEMTGDALPVIECMVPRQVVVMPSEISLDDLKEGQTIFVEIVKKRFELNDPKISVIARAVSSSSSKQSQSQSLQSLVQPFSAFAAPVASSIDDIEESESVTPDDASSTTNDASEDDEGHVDDGDVVENQRTADDEEEDEDDDEDDEDGSEKSDPEPEEQEEDVEDNEYGSDMGFDEPEPDMMDMDEYGSDDGNSKGKGSKGSKGKAKNKRA
jgi:DNA-directed RNA polymerase subunit E'/Rpb7